MCVNDDILNSSIWKNYETNIKINGDTLRFLSNLIENLSLDQQCLSRKVHVLKLLMPTLTLITTLVFAFSPLKTLLNFIGYMVATSSLNHDPYKNYHDAKTHINHFFFFSQVQKPLDKKYMNNSTIDELRYCSSIFHILVFFPISLSLSLSLSQPQQMN